jgi:drug/metabolite transporter (DMT)-like permease
LAFYQTAFVLPFAFICSAVHYQMPIFTPMVTFTILYTGILATVVVILIQLRYQKDTTAAHAAIIYTLEPVLASMIAIYVNDLPLSRNIIIGGGIIFMSVLLIELFPRLSLTKF